MFVFPVIALALVLVAAVVAVFSGHIPGVRALTGAARLQPDESPDAGAES